MRVQPHLLFPGMPIKRVRSTRAVINLRLFLRKIGSALRHRLYLHIFAGLHLDESLGGRPILAFGFPPHSPLEHRGIVIDGHRFSEAARKARTVIANTMRIVELVAANSNARIETTVRVSFKRVTPSARIAGCESTQSTLVCRKSEPHPEFQVFACCRLAQISAQQAGCAV